MLSHLKLPLVLSGGCHVIGTFLTCQKGGSAATEMVTLEPLLFPAAFYD
jgi:hypothetical protein